MIYGRMWLVVKPSVGVPLFLGAVAVSSFAVHVALLLNTTWVPKFLNGNAPPPRASLQAPGPVAASPPSLVAPATTVAAAPTGN